MTFSIKKKTLKKVVASLTMFATVVSMSGMMALSTVVAAEAITDGALIKSDATNPDGTPTLESLDVYIVKLVGEKSFKRLILNPTVFESYGHLNWGDIQTVSETVMGEYTTSSLVRVDTDPDEKVYAMAPDGDIGSKSWVNLTADEFVTDAGSDPDSIYTINATDSGNYTGVGDVTTVTELTTFYTTGNLPDLTPVPVEGALAVALSADTPTAASVPAGTTDKGPGVDMLKFNVTASSDGDVTISSLVLKKIGLSPTSGVKNVYLYEGETRLTNSKSVNSSTKNVTFSNIGYVVPAGTTKALTIKATLITAAQNHGFSIESATSITSDGVAVSGTFPITGNVMSTITVSDLGVLTTTRAGSATYTRKIGSENVEVGKFTLAVTNENATFKGITIYNSTNDILDNVKLYRGSTLLGTAAKSGKYLVFVFDTTDSIAKGDTPIYTMKADIISDNVNNTATLYQRYATDIDITGDTYGYNLVTTNNYNSSATHTTSLEAGAVTFAFNGPSTSDISVNTTNVTLFDFSIFAQSETKIERDEFTFTSSGANINTQIENVELVCDGIVLAQYAMTAAASNDISNSDEWVIGAGETKSCIIEADIMSGATPAETITVSLLTPGTAAVWTMTDVGTDTAVSSVVPSGTIAGNPLTLTSASLAVTGSATPTSKTWVKGTLADAVGFNFTAGSSADVKVTDIIVTAGFDDTVASTTILWTGSTADVNKAHEVIDSIELYDGATKIGSTEGLTRSTTAITATFDGLEWTVPAGTTKKLVAKVNLSTTAPYGGTSDLIALQIAAGAVTSEYGTGTTISSVPSSAVNDGTSPTIVQTVASAGTLTVNVEGAPSAALVVAGATEQVMAKYKINAVDEGFTINNLQIASSDGTTDFVTAASTNDNDVVRVGIREVGGTTQWGYLVSGIAAFANLDIVVPINSSIYVEIVADLNTIAGGATSGEDPRLGIYQIQTSAAVNIFKATGTSGGTKDYTTMLNTTVSGEENIKAMVLRETVPTIAKASGVSTTLLNGTNTLLGFTVAADAAEAVSLKRVILTMTGAHADLNANTFKLYRGTTNITDKVVIYKVSGAGTKGNMKSTTDSITDTNANTIYIMWDGTTEEIISAGDDSTYYLKATVSGAISTYSISTYIADDESALTTTTGVLATGGYDSNGVEFYHTAGTTVATSDIRVTELASVVATQDNTTVISTAANNVQLAYGLTNASENALTVTVDSDAAHKLEAAVGGTLVVAGFTCTAYDAVDGGGSAVAIGDVISGIRSVKCTDTGKQVVFNVTGAATPGDATSTITLAVDDDGYTAGTVVASTDSDVDLTVNAASTTHNLIWSDNSNTSHSVTSGSDWTNGYLVNDLAIETQTLTY